MVEKTLTLTETEWRRCLERFLRDRDHHISAQQATVTTPSGTLTLRWRPCAPRQLGRLRLPTLALTVSDDLPPGEARQLYQALDLATRRIGG